MAVLGQSGNVRISIAGQDVVGVEDGQEIAVLISFENGAIQGNATTESLTLVRDARQLAKAHIAGGLTGGVGVFEGLPMKIDVFNIATERNIFEGYFDLSQAEIDDSNGRILAPIVKAGGLESLDARLSALTYGFLESVGGVTDADYVDVEYVVQAENQAFESLVASVMIFLMAKELAESIRTIASDIATGAGDAAGGVLGPIGAAVFFALKLAANIIYAITILSAIIKLGRDLIAALVNPKRTHKAITFRRAMEVACARLGYTFQSSIAELSNVTYLPSNTSGDEFGTDGFLKKVGTIEKGIPKANDYGYNCSEFFALAGRMFNLKYAIVGTTVIAENDLASYWIKQSSYVMPDILPPKYGYNFDKAIANRSFNFSTDLKDEYTITNYKGTSYQVTLRPAIVGNAGNIALQGFADIDFNIALANRKDDLSGLDKVLANVAKSIDRVANIFGGNSNLAGKIVGRVGVMKVSNNYHSLPKAMYLDGGRIPANHRDLLSAKSLYNAYYAQDSLALTGQRLVYSGVTIPFSFSDFLKVLGNSYFYDNAGRVAKFNRVLWNSATGKADVDFEIEERYTGNLTETFNEQE